MGDQADGVRTLARWCRELEVDQPDFSEVE
jgi:hypothetical protein